ncbi:flagellar biosynthetic protein FliR [Psychromarinibacter sp. S121]|uniref:flagellar biosynthetic protein FliR n=1 Tax=Psychromarinibacter sp. S121 TaxID=3415127 RepID=UPI003C7DD58F
MGGGILAQLAEQWIYAVALIFARIGTATILLPGFGDQSVPPRAKITCGLALAIGLMPALPPPQVPDNTSLLILLIAIEATIGAFIGLGARAIMAALHILGAQIGFASGLSNSLTPNQANAESASAIASLLTMGAIAAIFLSNTHHVILMGLMRSYAILPPGQIMLGDLAEQMARLGGSAFYIAVAVGAPFYVLSLLLNLGMGLANRVMPAMQVFFVAAPGLIVAGLALLALAVPAILSYHNAELANWFETLVR